MGSEGAQDRDDRAVGGHNANDYHHEDRERQYESTQYTAQVRFHPLVKRSLQLAVRENTRPRLNLPALTLAAVGN